MYREKDDAVADTSEVAIFDIVDVLETFRGSHAPCDPLSFCLWATPTTGPRVDCHERERPTNTHIIPIVFDIVFANFDQATVWKQALIQSNNCAASQAYVTLLSIYSMEHPPICFTRICFEPVAAYLRADTSRGAMSSSLTASNAPKIWSGWSATRTASTPVQSIDSTRQ